MKKRLSLLLVLTMILSTFTGLNVDAAYRYSDTIDVIEGVEVFQEGGTTYWMAKFYDGEAKGYLTHDAYQGTTAYLVQASNFADTTNYQLHPEWSGVDAKVGSTYKFTFMAKPLKGTLDFLIRYGDDLLEKYTPTYYDPDTNQVVTENFEKKWYRAEVEFTMTEKGKSTWYGLGIISSTTYIMDDIKCYEKVDGSYNVVPECGLVIDDRFETHAKDFTENIPEEPEYRYSDTIAVVDGVEVFQEGGTTYWTPNWHDGEAKGYLTHDAYQGTTAYLVQASNNADTTNYQLHPEWSGVDAKVGSTYKFTIMAKPLKGTLDFSFRYGDDYDRFAPKYYDPETDEEVTENFEKKWYRVECEYKMTEAGKSTWVGLVVFSSTTYVMDDIKCYEKVDDSYVVVPECGLVIDDRFETHAKDFTENIPEEEPEEPEVTVNRFSDTIGKVENVEYFQSENVPYWMGKWHMGSNVSLYLTHDAYAGHSAMIIDTRNSDANTDTTNEQLQKTWCDGGMMVAGDTYKYVYMVKPLEGKMPADHQIKIGGAYEDYADLGDTKFYDAETNEEVTSGFEAKWYRAEVPFTMTQAMIDKWYGLTIMTKTLLVVDDVKLMQLHNGSYREVNSIAGQRNGDFEEGVSEDYTDNNAPVVPEEPEQPEEPEIGNIYSDTIEVIEGVEVFKEGVPFWLNKRFDGSATTYLSHDSYNGNAAMLVVASDVADTTNEQLSKDLGVDYIKAGDTYRIEYMIKPLKGEMPAGVRYWDDYNHYTPVIYDIATNEVVTENFENKWYKAVAEFTMTEKETQTWYGTAFRASTTYLVDDVKMYQLYNGEYRFVPEWYGVRNGEFEHEVSDDYEELTYAVYNLETADNVVAGTNTVTVNVMNISEEDFSAELILALYDADTDTFIKAGGSEKKSIAIGGKEKLTASIDVPSLDSGNYEIKVFVWEALANARPLISSVTITE